MLTSSFGCNTGIINKNVKENEVVVLNFKDLSDKSLTLLLVFYILRLKLGTLSNYMNNHFKQTKHFLTLSCNFKVNGCKKMQNL